MKVVITGGNGYIGSRLCLYLADKGIEVVPICFPCIPDNEEWKGKMSAIYEGDLRNDDTLSLIVSLKPDAIIHLVSLDHFESEKAVKFVNGINVLPTWNLLEASYKEGLKKFIYFSTIHVYGRNQHGLITEQTKPTPANAYGLTHLLSEEICNYYNRKTGLNCINVRLSNSYGEPVLDNSNCWNLVINDLCLSAFRNKKIVLKSDGKAMRDFIHYSVICESIYLLLKKSENFDEENTIHFSSGESISIIQAAKLVQEVYTEKYGDSIDIFINGNELLTEIKITSKSDYQISTENRNNLLNKNIPLKKGIESLLSYIEANNINIKTN